MKETEIEPTKMSVEDAVKMVVSAGKFVPPDNGSIVKIEDKTEQKIS